MKSSSSNRFVLVLLASTGLVSFTAYAQAGEHNHSVAVPASAASPYAGEQTREIKALSKSDVNNLMGGAGMGFAKAAELNGYPGPMHVLELARSMRVTDEQRVATEKLLKEHKREARELGAQIVALERQLDASFASKSISDPKLATLTNDIASLQGKLRNAHLQTHLRQTALLQPDQVVAYQSLRGYVTSDRTSH